MTETEEVVEQETAAEAEESGQKLGDELWARFEKGCGFTPPKFLRSLLPWLWLDAPSVEPGERELEVARQLGAMLVAPLRAIDVDPAAMTSKEFRSYALAIIPGLRTAAGHISNPTTKEEDDG